MAAQRSRACARGVVGAPMLLVALWLGLCMLIKAAQADFQCGPKPHTTTPEMGANGLCQCGPGWLGPTCEVCMTDQACAILLKDNEGVCRDKAFTAIRDIYGWCEVSSEDVANLIHGTGYVQIYFATNGTFFFDFIKRRGAGDFISLFRCDSKATKVTEDPKLGQVRYASPDLTCALTCEIGSDRTCSQGLANIVQNVGAKGGSTIVCDPQKRTCDVHENVLDTFLGGVQTSGCYMSECALKGEMVSVSVGSSANIARQPPAQQTAYVLGMLLLGLTLALLAVAGSYYARSGKYASYASTAALLGLAGAGKGSGKQRAAQANVATAAAPAATNGVVASPALQSEEEAVAGPGGGLGGAGGAAAMAAGAVGAGAGGTGGRSTYTLAWEGLRYAVGRREILRGVSGYALPGELLAVMGPSGSGKTTLIDVLAMKPKRGGLEGQLYYEGRKRGEDAGTDEAARAAIGFVDQEDNLMGTLTVFEAVLFSAFLRLPDGMPMAAKAARVLQVLQDLRIAHVADSPIGIKGRRGISGGEKRRVVVAAELVKVPAVLFLDEPTSGLDSYSAALLVDCLRDLAFRHRTNVVMTIHQPRSNVFTGFDRNLVLNQGEVTYFGTTKEVPSYFASIGHAIPQDYNPADFLIDVLFLSSEPHMAAVGQGQEAAAGNGNGGEAEGAEAKDGGSEVEMVQQFGGRKPSRASFQQRLVGGGGGGGASASAAAGTTTGGGGALSPPRVVRVSIDDAVHTEGATGGLDLSEQSTSSHGASNPAAKEGVPVLPATSPRSHHPLPLPLPPPLASWLSGKRQPSLLPAPEPNPFALAFARSERAVRFREELAAQIKQGKDGGREAGSVEGSTATADSAGSSPNTAAAAAAQKRSSSVWALAGARVRRWCWEVGVLSRRSLLDLWRNPVLFLSHLGATTYFAVVLGTVYYDLSMSNLQAVQNRLGAFLLSCVFLCFTSVSALPLFWLEKNLYLHEQSNRFYSASAYFVCKIFFDLIPLRVLPTIIYGAITYGMIGLRPGFQHFVLYEAFLVLLVTTSAVLALIIGMLTRHIMSGILIATIVMIHFLMLTNLFINFDSMNIKGLRFLKRVSFFNYAYEGMAENELVGRRLEHFAIPTGTGVLHELGFSTSAMYFDLMSLLIYFMVAVAIAFVVLKVAVREMR